MPDYKAEMKEMYQSGASMYHIAQLYGMDAKTVGKMGETVRAMILSAIVYNGSYISRLPLFPYLPPSFTILRAFLFSSYSL